MQLDRVVAVRSTAGRGSGYLVADRLVLTSAHVVDLVGTTSTVRVAAGRTDYTGAVVWRGAPGGSDDAALVRVDAPDWQSPRSGPVRWGRVVTNQPGIEAHACGFPEWAQRDTWQASGIVNPGNRYVGDRYVLSLTVAPPVGAAPWAGLSGGGMFCAADLLTGVLAADVAFGQHGHLDVVPVYVLHRDPEFRRALAEHGGAAMVLEPVEADQLAERMAPPPLTSPAALLRADLQAVRFHGREQLMADLLDWCNGPGISVQLLYGPGGQGKTRVALELATRLQQRAGDERWATVWLSENAPETALDVFGRVTVPLLVTVDYAETRTRQVTAVLRACARRNAATPVRLLLLARTAGDWWTDLPVAHRDLEMLLGTARTVPLGELETESAGRVDAYQHALTAFAEALAAVPDHRGDDWPAIAQRLAPADADDLEPATALTLHIRALAALLDAAEPASTDGGSRASAEDQILLHEERYWLATAAAHGLHPALSRATLSDALTAAILVGAKNRRQAEKVLANLPTLADQSHDRRNRVLSWISQLYPPPASDSRPWGTLQPDRLAERLAGIRLGLNPQLMDDVIAVASRKQRRQLLTVYARAAAQPAFRGELDQHLRALCLRHSPLLARPAIHSAARVEAPGPLIAAVHDLATDPGTSIHLIGKMATSVGRRYRSRGLAECATELSQRLTDEERRMAHNSRKRERAEHWINLAEWLPELSNWQRLLGRPQEALATAEEAVEIRRRFARKRPDIPNVAHLAWSLDHLALRLGASGRHDDGRAADEEAVDLFRRLNEVYPSSFLELLAKALQNLSVHLAALNRGDEALAAAQEAVDTRRQAVEQRPTNSYFELELARALDNLAALLGELGRPGESSTAREGADGIRRQLASQGLYTDYDDSFELLLVEIRRGRLMITRQW